jgi:hypothetical protein
MPPRGKTMYDNKANNPSVVDRRDFLKIGSAAPMADLNAKTQPIARQALFFRNWA